MRNYTSNDIKELFEQYKGGIQFVLVAHTYHRPYVINSYNPKFKDINAAKYLERKLYETKKATRHALNCLNSLLYLNASNKVKRNPLLFKPLCFVTVEGVKDTTDRAKTIHINVAIGNLPKHLSKTDFEQLFRKVWCEKAQQKDDIWSANYDQERNFLGYAVKEGEFDVERAFNENSIWDVDNCWVPHVAINNMRPYIALNTD